MPVNPSKIYRFLRDHFGTQDWWPVDEEYHRENESDPRFEIIVGAILFSRFLTATRMPHEVAAFIGALPVNRVLILVGFLLLYLVLGMFLEGIGMMAITLPLVLPVLEVLGFDLIWFGVMYVVLAEIGMITPPMGLNLFVIQGISREDLWKVVIGSVPFFFIMLIGIALFTAFPAIVLWFPTLLFRS